MLKEQEEFKNAVDKIIEAVMFENWLRFYFISPMEEEGNPDSNDEHLFLILSDKALKKIEELYPELLPMAMYMNKKELSFELSQKTISIYVVENIDGHIIPRDTAQSIMNSMAFQTQLELFNTWISLHEDQLEQGFSDFGAWKEMFANWQESESGHELKEKIILSKQGQVHKMTAQ
ncbi:MAG: hypothetical protein IJT59_06930 [Desulfovibrionaceae bacterium]|nr:hypothetical protein [Desulfovibrionaceae bacterium]